MADVARMLVLSNRKRSLMKNLLKVSVIATAVMIGVFAYSAPTAMAGFGPSMVISAETNSSPRSLYNANCASCHGRDGQSNTAKGRETDADDLTTSKVQGMSAAKMSGIIKRGKGDMPGFGKKLTVAQISQIVNHVKTF